MVSAAGEVTLTDVVRHADGGPAEAVTVDLFQADQNGRRAGFVASAETDAAGRYRLNASIGGGQNTGSANPPAASDCLVAVFVAPSTLLFEESGRFREALVCPTESGAVLPQVRLLPESEPVGAVEAAAPLLERSVLASGGKLYLRGLATDDAEAVRLARRYQWSIGSARVVPDYCCADTGSNAAGSSASTGATPAGSERVSIDGGLNTAFELGTADLGGQALLVTRQMATVLKWNPTARIRVVVAVDPSLDEQPTEDLLTARQQAVVTALGSQVSGDRIELSALSTVTEGRRLGGRSIDSQLEFVLLWR